MTAKKRTPKAAKVRPTTRERMQAFHTDVEEMLVENYADLSAVEVVGVLGAIQYRISRFADEKGERPEEVVGYA